MANNFEIITRLLMAAVFGGVIGIERERLNWAAGLRTHMLVAVGSTLVMLVSAFGFADASGNKSVALDPSRMAAQVVSGIGFLGAGSILLRGEVVRGLTTAASLWSVAGVGLAVGGGMYVAALAATIIILFILAGVKPLEKRYIATKQERQIDLLVEQGALTFNNTHTVLGAGSVRVKKFISYPSEENPGFEEVCLGLSRVSKVQYEAICARLEDLSGVKECRRSI